MNTACGCRVGLDTVFTNMVLLVPQLHYQFGSLPNQPGPLCQNQSWHHNQPMTPVINGSYIFVMLVMAYAGSVSGMKDRICDKRHIRSKNLCGCLVILCQIRGRLYSFVYRKGALYGVNKIKSPTISHRTLHMEQCSE